LPGADFNLQKASMAKERVTPSGHYPAKGNPGRRQKAKANTKEI
jgi:hypothetical protein